MMCQLENNRLKKINENISDFSEYLFGNVENYFKHTHTHTHTPSITHPPSQQKFAK